MSSILTNSSALTALQNLAATQKSLQTTQSQISTGLKVSSSADNASYWSIASTMKSDNGALGAVKTSLSQSAAMLSFTNSAVNNVISVMNQIKSDLVAAKQPGADLAKIGTDITQATKQLTSIVNSSTFSGVNLFDQDYSRDDRTDRNRRRRNGGLRHSRRRDGDGDRLWHGLHGSLRVVVDYERHARHLHCRR